ncbi:MAG: DNA polymerase/3'-5' exonuclease PolX, partial [Desulfosalsimonadaceae bacterium]
MYIQNPEIQDIFNQVADLMEIRGDNPFRIRAYREAARIVGTSAEDMTKMVRQDEDLTRFQGIGKELSEKIKEIVTTGNLSFLEQLKQEVPVSLLDILQIPELGPRKVAALYHKLGITTVEELADAAKKGKIAELEGFGQKSQEKIANAIGRAKKASAPRMLLSEAKPQAMALQAYIQGLEGVKQTGLAGSFRRGKETVGDLDILVSCRRGLEKQVMQAFVDYSEVDAIHAHGRTKSSVTLRSGLQVDLRIVAAVSYGAALHYFTGSKAHNVAVRQLAGKKGLKINEYGVYENSTRIAGKTEEEVYKSAGLSWIAPELRENRGEIEAAASGSLPELIRLSDIRGDLHMHTNYTDGRNSLEEMAEAAEECGYEYIAITDHSRQVTVAGGMDEKELRRQMEAIDRLNEKLTGITVLKGIEVDIRADGSLDLPDSVLRELDLTVCSVHYHQRLGREKQTERIIRALDNPFANILGHPSGRLINRREPMALDMEALIKAAGQRGVVMEINSQPDRLDLANNYCKTAACAVSVWLPVTFGVTSRNWMISASP